GERGEEPNRKTDEHQVGDGRQALLQELLGSLLGRAEALNLGEGSALVHVTLPAAERASRRLRSTPAIRPASTSTSGPPAKAQSRVLCPRSGSGCRRACGE